MSKTGFGLRLFLALALAATLARAGRESAKLKDWIDGPVLYLTEKEETRAFRALETDDARALFIEKFWARRDPTSDTLANELRQTFWERVKAANTLFLDSHKPGWKTDRGKIYVLYGPPTSIEDHANLATEDGHGRGLIRWHYSGRPAGRMDLNPEVIVPFVPDSGGEYRVSYDPKLSSVFFDEFAVRTGRDQAMDRFLELSGAPRRTDMAVMLDLGRMQEVPPQSRVLMERIETIESYHTRALDVELDRYWHPDQNAVVAVVTVDLGAVGSGKSPEVIGRFLARVEGAEPRMLGDDSFRVTQLGTSGRRVAQARIVLEPGDYDLTVLVADPSAVGTGLFRKSFRAAPGSDELRLSDVVWAAELEPLRYRALQSYDEPFHVGPFRVVPRLRSDFARGEVLRLFYEIYGARAPFRVQYQVEGQELDGTWVALGRPTPGEPSVRSQGWEVPTSPQWPTGEYRVRIEVEDDLGRQVTAHLPFRLDAPPDP